MKANTRWRNAKGLFCAFIILQITTYPYIQKTITVCMCLILFLTTKPLPLTRMKLVVVNLKLYESLEGNFPTLGRVSSVAFNVWAEKEQVRYLVKVSGLSEEIPGFREGGFLECPSGGSASVKDRDLPCLTTLLLRQSLLRSSFTEKSLLHCHLTLCNAEMANSSRVEDQCRLQRFRNLLEVSYWQSFG